jgi:RNA polymerase sigma-70 factor (ECF subfamily)
MPADVNAEDDAELLERVAQQDHSAFATLVQRHTVRFFRVAYRFLRNPAESEDVVQDAFLKLWERPGLWQADRNTAFTTWFYRIIVNQCLDFAKKKRPMQLMDDSWVRDERPTHEESLLENEKQRLLEQQIAKLPERQRVALNLCFYESLSNQQAADIMGIRLKALQALLMRAKTTLKEALKFMAGGATHD